MNTQINKQKSDITLLSFTLSNVTNNDKKKKIVVFSLALLRASGFHIPVFGQFWNVLLFARRT